MTQHYDSSLLEVFLHCPPYLVTEGTEHYQPASARVGSSASSIYADNLTVCVTPFLDYGFLFFFLPFRSVLFCRFVSFRSVSFLWQVAITSDLASELQVQHLPALPR